MNVAGGPHAGTYLPPQRRWRDREHIAPLLIALLTVGVTLGGLLRRSRTDRRRSGPSLSPDQERTRAFAERRHAAVLERSLRARRPARGREPCRRVLSTELAVVRCSGRLGGVPPFDVAALRCVGGSHLRLRPTARSGRMGRGPRGACVHALRVPGDPLEPRAVLLCPAVAGARAHPERALHARRPAHLALRAGARRGEQHSRSGIFSSRCGPRYSCSQPQCGGRWRARLPRASSASSGPLRSGPAWLRFSSC